MGDLIFTLVFELFNASRDTDFQYLNDLAYSRQISRGDYITSCEWIEFQNIQATAQVLNEGISLGILPVSCYKYYSEDFEEHLSVQKSSGHSEWHGRSYDSLRSWS
jgi:hypothetical protein